MERTDFSRHRVLLVGPKSHTLQLLRSVMNISGVGKIVHVEEARRRNVEKARDLGLTVMSEDDSAG